MKKLWIILLSLCCSMLLCSCGIPKEAGPAEGGYTVIDDKGNAIHLSEKPRRIVTLALASDEIVLSMVPPERMAAVSYLAVDEGISTVTDKAEAISHRMKNYVPEDILACHPDLVIAPDWTSDEVIQSLKDLGLTVYISRGSLTIDTVKVTVKEIAEAIGEPEKAQPILDEMEADMAKAEVRRNAIPKDQRKTVVLYSHLKGYVGKGSMFDDLCEQAGVINGAAVIGMGRSDPLSKESLVKMNPDVIFTPTWAYKGVDPESVKEELLTDPSLQSVKAIQEKALRQIPDKYILSAAPGMTKAMLAMQDAVYGAGD